MAKRNREKACGSRAIARRDALQEVRSRRRGNSHRLAAVALEPPLTDDRSPPDVAQSLEGGNVAASSRRSADREAVGALTHSASRLRSSSIRRAAPPRSRLPRDSGSRTSSRCTAANSTWSHPDTVAQGGSAHPHALLFHLPAGVFRELTAWLAASGAAVTYDRSVQIVQPLTRRRERNANRDSQPAPVFRNDA